MLGTHVVPAGTCVSLLSEQSALNSLEVEPRYNPLHVKSNLYKYLVSGFSRPQYRQQAQPKEHRPGERHHSRQVQILPAGWLGETPHCLSTDQAAEVLKALSRHDVGREVETGGGCVLIVYRPACCSGVIRRTFSQLSQVQEAQAHNSF